MGELKPNGGNMKDTDCKHCLKSMEECQQGDHSYVSFRKQLDYWHERAVYHAEQVKIYQKWWDETNAKLIK
jgi:hypothetical protein